MEPKPVLELVARRSAVSATLLEVVPALSVVVAGSLRIVWTHRAAVLLEPSHRDSLPVAEGRPACVATAILCLAWCCQQQGCGSSKRKQQTH